MNKSDDPIMPYLQTATASSTQPIASGSRSAIDRRIRAFLNGESHGEDVLGALYGAAANEPIPEQLRAALKM